MGATVASLARMVLTYEYPL